MSRGIELPHPANPDVQKLANDYGPVCIWEEPNGDFRITFSGESAPRDWRLRQRVCPSLSPGSYKMPEYPPPMA